MFLVFGYRRGRGENEIRQYEGNEEKACPAEVLRRGIAPDGGLYVPDTWIRFSLDEITQWGSINYPAGQKNTCAIFPEYGAYELQDIYGRRMIPGNSIMPILFP